ncbi:DUF4166 domain-containing protein [Methylobacterium sp. Leaf118]|uniref:DUF4166 domain-containing protein n=1 Tax=Methylobacterium sp. Leaf118 TaxID=2876562 RepID=UPI001E5539F9|nr:DUF4166 domain-containing protein [Methylobacterium sp. Leaf118]
MPAAPPLPVSNEARPAERLDLRFRALVPETDWARLPPAVRHRFTKRLGDGQSAVYAGQVIETRLSRLGWLLAQALRLVGAPLPTTAIAGVPSVVAVMPDPGGGQVWTRLYARGTGFPQAIHSAKRFRGPTGLEEHVGAGLGMSLRVTVEGEALVFRSERYFVERFGLRITLPGWLTPGRLTVRHAATGPHAFRFSFEIRHSWIGLLLSQEAEFSDQATMRAAA